MLARSLAVSAKNAVMASKTSMNSVTTVIVKTAMAVSGIVRLLKSAGIAEPQEPTNVSVVAMVA